MKPLWVQIILNVLAILLFGIGYFTFRSKELYSGPHFIRLYYPLAVVLGLVIFCLLNMVLFKNGRIPALAAAGSAILFTVIVTLLCSRFYGSILNDYYRSTPAHNLLQLGDYGKLKGNYITLYKSLRTKGILPRTLSTGNASGAEGQDTLSQDSVQFEDVLYLVNGETYLIYNWSRQEVQALLPGEEVYRQSLDYLEGQASTGAAKLQGEAGSYWLKARNIIITYGQDSYSVKLYPEDGKIRCGE